MKLKYSIDTLKYHKEKLESALEHYKNNGGDLNSEIALSVQINIDDLKNGIKELVIKELN